MMKVFKFGGASTNSIERIRMVSKIVLDPQNPPLCIIVSAMGKTTNALEKVVEAFFDNNKQLALQLYGEIKNQHIETAKQILVASLSGCLSMLNDYFTEAEWLLHEKPVRPYDYYYDQLVCLGEVFSTIIISHFLQQEGFQHKWMDVRDVVKTDNNFRDAAINWTKTKEALAQWQADQEKLTENKSFLTQGFIGCTDENESTTLGREGSDYTAAIFASLLNAENVTIWKDVVGVMNADPKQFPSAQVIPQLGYEEVIEMAFYGAQVIHPKTIKPLQNKNIPLLVKSFLDPTLPGTVISSQSIKNLPPIIVYKARQVLIHLHSKDFSFVGEELMINLYMALKQLAIKPNLLQVGAISLQVCLDDTGEKTNRLATELSAYFDVVIEKGLSILTVRHHTKPIVEELLQEKQIILEQRTTNTFQAIFK